MRAQAEAFPCGQLRAGGRQTETSMQVSGRLDLQLP